MIKSMKIVLVSAALILLVIVSCHSGSHRRQVSSGDGTMMQPTASMAVPTGKTFATPEEAMKTIGEFAGSHDEAKVDEVFGEDATDVLWSGDEVADREAGTRIKAMIAEGVTLEEMDGGRVCAAIGKDKWQFPIPLVKVEGGWRFDLAEGKEEVLNRRIGRNELFTIATMYEYVDAQREYFEKGRDGNPPAYAQKVRSTEGKHDGLYWPMKEGEEASPFGELIASASAAGYGPKGDEPRPFHGYNYRILTSCQKSYLDAKGLMTGGYAGIAWPATYGNSGIMTFIVNQSGVVFQKDLGAETNRLASTMTAYSPDRSWMPSAKPATDK